MSNKCLTIKTLGSVDSDNFHVGEIRLTGIAPKSGGIFLVVKFKGDYNIECNLPMVPFNGVGNIGYQPLEKDTPYTFKIWNVLNASLISIFCKGYTNVEFFEKDNHDIEALQYFTDIQELQLQNTNVSGDIKNLSTLVNLTSLYLNNTNISGDIKNLSTLVNLRGLNLNSTNVSGDIKNLSTLVNLTELQLSKNVDMTTHLKDFLIALYNSGRNGKDLHIVKEIGNGVTWNIGSGTSGNYNVKFSENTIILQEKWSDNPKTYLTGTKGGDGNWTWVES